MATLGYARVSTSDQTTDLQLDALAAAGCSRVYRDEAVSGSVAARPGLAECLSALGEGDTLVVWRLDRLGRSLPHLIATIALLQGRGVGLRSLTEAIDTSTASGRLVVHVLASLAEYERALIVERTRAGIAAARKRGVKMGPQYRLRPDQIEHAQWLIAQGERVRRVARLLSVDRATLYRALARARADGIDRAA